MARLLTVLCSAVLLSACLGNPGTVRMEGSAFSPEEITVAAGETVIWRNTSHRAHSVTAHEDGIPDGAKYFASGGAASEEQARDETAEGC